MYLYFMFLPRELCTAYLDFTLTRPREECKQEACYVIVSVPPVIQYSIVIQASTQCYLYYHSLYYVHLLHVSNQLDHHQAIFHKMYYSLLSCSSNYKYGFYYNTYVLLYFGY
jgi:hypothetical protein